MFTPKMPVVVFTNNLIDEAVDKNEAVVVCTDNRDFYIRAGRERLRVRDLI